jgi:hypothetical protein
LTAGEGAGGGAGTIISPQPCTANDLVLHTLESRVQCPETDIQLLWCLQVKVSESVLSGRVRDTSVTGFFFLKDGTEEPFWKALKERVGKGISSACG